MKLTYYQQQRISKRLIDVVMILLLIVTLFPIFWMVFSSFKSNTEILLGKVPFGRAGNDVVRLEARGRNLFAFTADGGINEYDINSGKLDKHTSVKAMAASYITDSQNIWIGTADKGLVQISIDDISRKRHFGVDEKGLDINKIATTSLCQDESTLWLALQQKGIEKIFVFDKETRSFRDPISFSGDLSPCMATSLIKHGGLLWIGTNKGIISVNPDNPASIRFISNTAAGLPLADLKKMVLYNGNFLIAAQEGLYEFSPSALRVVRRWGESSGLASDTINSVYVDGADIFAATNSGLSVISAGGIKNYTDIFDPVRGSKEQGRVVGDVFSILREGGMIYAGSSGGRISVLDGATGSVSKTLLANEGHVTVRWRNYVDLWKNIDFGLYLRNSLIICGITMLLAMIFATTAAYALARFNFPGNQLFSVGVLATQMIPAIMYLIPIYIMFTRFTMLTGLPMKGTYFGLIMIYSAFFIPFSIWILRGFFAAIPVELEEAARIDGCSPFQVFWYVVLPLAIPGIIATGVYVFLTAWDELMFAWVLCNADTMTIPVGIRLFVGNYQNRFDLMMAAATVATIPVMILFFMLQKYIVKGLTAGAVKG